MSRTVGELRSAIAGFEGTCLVAFESGYLHVREDGRWSRIASLDRTAVVEREAEERGSPGATWGDQEAPGALRAQQG